MAGGLAADPGGRRPVTPAFRRDGAVARRGERFRPTAYSAGRRLTLVGDAADADRSHAGLPLERDGGDLGAWGFLPERLRGKPRADVAVLASGTINICGYGKGVDGRTRRFCWTGDATGAGTFALIPRLAGERSNRARHCGSCRTAAELIFVTARRHHARPDAHRRRVFPEAFRYRSDSGSSLAWAGNTSGYGITRTWTAGVKTKTPRR